jgi:UDPglucose 6-dehydrogenase
VKDFIADGDLAMPVMKIGVVGVGHVGLVTAAAFADLGHEVVAMKLEDAKIELLRAGKSPFDGPGLDELLERPPPERLRFETDPAAAVGSAHVVIICVGRPANANGDTSLTAVEAVGLDLGRVRELAAYPIVVDGRNVLDPDAPEAAGLTYLPVGRPARRTERAG